MHIPKILTTATRMALITLTLLVFVSAQAGAAALTWSGAVDDKFNNIGNWTTSVLPANGDDLSFPPAAVALRGAPINDMVGLALNAINITASYTISGNALSVTSINSDSTATISLPLSPNGAGLTITVSSAPATLSLSGLITGISTGTISYAGPGIKQLNGTVNNTFPGTTIVSMGELKLASTVTDAIAGPLTINSGALVTLVNAAEIKNTVVVADNGTLSLATMAAGTDASTDNETIGGLTGTGLVALGANKLGCQNQIATTNFSGGFTGTGGFRQALSGTQVLSGTTTASTGAMTLAGGSLHIWGTQASAPVNVTAGTLVLSNDSTVGAITISGGASSALSFNETLASQNMHGTTTALTVGSGSAFQVVTRSASSYSNVTTPGIVTLTGAVLSVNTSLYTPVVGVPLTIIHNNSGSAVVGTFAQGTTVAASNNSATIFTISYTGGTSTNDVTLTATAVAGDTTPPVISSVAAGTLTATSATVTWTTNEASDSQVEYGTTVSYGSMTTLDGTLVTSHSVAVSGLTASTMYHYRVLSKDASGNLATGSDMTFTTTATGGTATAGTATAGTTTAGTTSAPMPSSSSSGSSCGLGGGGLALMLALGLFAARRRT